MLVTCPSCGEKGKLQSQFVGQRIKCRKCATGFVVAAPEPPAQAAPPKPVPANGGIEVDGLDESSWSAQAEPAGGPAREPAPEPDKVASLFTVSPFPESPRAGAGGSAPKQYKILTPKDKWFENKFDLGRLEEALNHFARQGWVVRSMATPHVAAFSGGTKEELVILLERSTEP